MLLPFCVSLATTEMWLFYFPQPLLNSDVKEQRVLQLLQQFEVLKMQNVFSDTFFSSRASGFAINTDWFFSKN